MSILIAIPTGSHVENDVFVALWKLDKAGHDVDMAIMKGYEVDDERNDLVEYALGKGYEYVMFVDSDTVPPQDALKNMLEHDADVVFGYYQASNGDDGVTCLCKSQRQGDAFSGSELHEMESRGEHLIDVWRGGFGCALVRASLFGKLERPYFKFVYRQDGTKLSEDYYFCFACRKAGVKIYADTRVACKHILRDVVEI